MTNKNIARFQDVRSTLTDQSHFYIPAMYYWKPNVQVNTIYKSSKKNEIEV